MEERFLPIGIQNFEDLRTKNFIYIDKTDYVYKLAREGKPYFLSRPRRFGKSLLLSTMEAYFLGKKELFKGLALEKLEKDWTVYPIIKISFGSGSYETKEKLLKAGAEKVLMMSEILNQSVDGSGYSPYGLLGSNRSTEERVKLFPRTGNALVNKVQAIMKERTGKTVEVMVYGDGAFKDPVGKIWELADPVVSPAYTPGLEGSPNEIKLKYFPENKFKDLHGEELAKAMKEEIRAKDKELKGTMATQGTTPRRYTDLLGSLCDLTSGSGDKGTPVVLIQRYFTNYSND